MWTKDNITDQTGKTVIVTGANAGIGYETALALYNAGAHVILACRSLSKAQETIAKIEGQNGSGTLEAAILDLANLKAIKQFADDFKQKHQQLHILINNAGVMIPPASKTDDGFELQFGVNFIGHYALTGDLYPLLKVTPGSRIVSVSSMAYLRGEIDFDNLKSEKSYDPMREYAQSKLANLLFSNELQRRINAAGDQIMSTGAQPGANKTELSRHMDKDAYNAAVERVGGLMEPWQGALPSLYAAVNPNAKGGQLYSPDQDGGYRGYPALLPMTANALDETVAKKLWNYAEQVTGVVYP
ncbi:oxidoreductase [Mucilaginibacter agri]|uniref:SDR family NAD(P)-dependent oxidoreductase n=1 Tax=Mucilaginibacter agri TaxID=2695265 RepID=A0A965ZFK5_9SPHI|nr:oxidoreductase [Mucilaginibacter agri]NCD70129.1 SDR family NAD(P)-dependent oxidoreductase [Mucilaginibacter agri]